MDFTPSSRAAELTEAVAAFIADHISPIEQGYHRELAQIRSGGDDAWTPLPVLAELRDRARADGLWNLFLPAGVTRASCRYARSCTSKPPGPSASTWTRSLRPVG
ncbi:MULTISPECIES: hypothetical protein [Nocardioides]|uniref:Acyl-CoA dehydrogenase/oxidase N-terminal domain-containing protein n=1 Tax=Nocardioides vastitatis TaxID=2568655 RepID=A0ABW0ZJS6_9ACTN|nr:hypothetical protein [Nocardioides sp.]